MIKTNRIIRLVDEHLINLRISARALSPKWFVQFEYLGIRGRVQSSSNQPTSRYKSTVNFVLLEWCTIKNENTKDKNKFIYFIFNFNLVRIFFGYGVVWSPSIPETIPFCFFYNWMLFKGRTFKILNRKFVGGWQYQLLKGFNVNNLFK